VALLALGVPVAPPPPSWSTLLTGWSLPPIPTVSVLVAAGLYVRGVRIVAAKTPRHPIAPWRRNCFLAGLGVLMLSVASPIGLYDTTFFWVHMIQHLLILNVAAPLLMIGTPVTVWIRASSPRMRRHFVLPLLRSKPVAFLTFPIVTWIMLGPVVLYATHFTPVFDVALRNDWVHELEHALYLFAACLFWWPVVGKDPSRWKLGYPAKLLYLFLAMPVLTFLGLALYNTDQVIYPTYAAVVRDYGVPPLQDQKLAGYIMWVPGGMFFLAALLWTAKQWLDAEKRKGERYDAWLDAREAARKATETSPEG